MSKVHARLLIARDPKKPQYLHELNGSVVGGDLNILVEGLTVPRTNKQQTKTGGFKHGGQSVLGTKYNNKTIIIDYQIKSNSSGHGVAINNSLTALANIINNNSDNNSVYKAYIEIFPPNSPGMYTPLLGQYSKLLEIVDIVGQSGNSLSHDGHNTNEPFLLLNNQLTIECKPFLQGNTELLPPTAAAVFNSPYGTVLHKQIETIANHLPDPAFNQDVVTSFWQASDPDVGIERLGKPESLLNGDLRVTNNTSIFNGVLSNYAADTNLLPGDNIIISALVHIKHELGEAKIRTRDSTIIANKLNSPYVLNGKHYQIIWAAGDVLDPLLDQVGVFVGGYTTADIAIIQVTKVSFTSTYPIPMAMGDLMGYKWNGEPHASVTLAKTEQNKITHRIEGGLNKPFTISFWYSPLYKAFTIENLETPILRYDTDTAEFWEVGVNVNGLLYYKNSLPNTITDLFSNENRFYITPVHICITRGDVVGTITVYRNGVLVMTDFSGDNPNNIYTKGDLSFLGDAQGIIDGFKLWDNIAMSAEQIQKIYQQEKPIKEGGGSVSNGLPYLYTKEGFNKIGNIDGFTTKDDLVTVVDTSNHAIIGGLSGHAPTVPNIKIINDDVQSVPSPDTIYLSIVDYHKQFNINSTFYLDCNDPLVVGGEGFGQVGDSAIFSNLNGPLDSSMLPGQEYYYMFTVGGGGTFGQTTPSGLRDFRGTVLKNTQHAHLLTGNIKALVKGIFFDFAPHQTKEFELVVGYGLELLRGNGDVFVTSDGMPGIAVIPFYNIYLSNERFKYNNEIYIGIRFKSPSTNTDTIFASLDTITLLKNVAEIRVIGDNGLNNYVSISNQNIVSYQGSDDRTLSSVAVGFVDGNIALVPSKYNYLMMARYDNEQGQKFHNIDKFFEYNKFRLGIEYAPLWEV